jgi:hypothetical protein
VNGGMSTTALLLTCATKIIAEGEMGNIHGFFRVLTTQKKVWI